MGLRPHESRMRRVLPPRAAAGTTPRPPHARVWAGEVSPTRRPPPAAQGGAWALAGSLGGPGPPADARPWRASGGPREELPGCVGRSVRRAQGEFEATRACSLALVPSEGKGAERRETRKRGVAARIAPANAIPQVAVQHGSCVEYGCRWLHYGCTDTVLRELVTNWQALTPAAKEKIIDVLRGRR
jgi:hypothetical protein